MDLCKKPDHVQCEFEKKKFYTEYTDNFITNGINVSQFYCDFYGD